MISDWKQYINRDMPDIGPITDDTVACTSENAARFRSSARISSSRIMTDVEFQER